MGMSWCYGPHATHCWVALCVPLHGSARPTYSRCVQSALVIWKCTRRPPIKLWQWSLIDHSSNDVRLLLFIDVRGQCKPSRTSRKRSRCVSGNAHKAHLVAITNHDIAKYCLKGQADYTFSLRFVSAPLIKETLQQWCNLMLTVPCSFVLLDTEEEVSWRSAQHRENAQASSTLARTAVQKVFDLAARCA